MNEIFIALFFGALAGTVRTYMTHDLRLIVPTVTIRNRSFKIRLGWLASALLGAIMAWATVTGLYYTGMQATTPVEVILVSIFMGYTSLKIVNRWYGGRLPDIDIHEYDLRAAEPNLQKFELIQGLMKTVKCIERVQIRDDFKGGTAQVFVVPKSGCDPQTVKQDAERYIAKYGPIGVMMYVELPMERLVGIELTALILDVAEHDYDWYKSEIEMVLRNYIDSLPPGKWVHKNKIIKKAMLDRFVQDARNLVTVPAIEEGLYIKIGTTEVARAAGIIIRVEVISTTTNGY